MPVSEKFKRIVRITAQIEKSSRDVPATGYSRNHYGGYDKIDLTKGLLDEFHRIPADERDGDLKRLHAEALMRARHYSEAANLLAQIVDTHDPANILMAMVQLSLGNERSADHFISRHNSYCERSGMNSMIVSRDSLIPSPPTE